LFIGCGPSARPGEESAPPHISDKGADVRQKSAGETIDEPPVMIHEEIPEYPLVAQELGIEADVTILALVGESGKVKKAKVWLCSSPGYGFEEAAVKAAYKSRYLPGKENGKPYDCWVTYKVKFSLDK